MKRFGEIVREARKAKNRTLEQVARKIGSHKGYVSGIENGKVNPPSAGVVRRLAKYLDLNFEEALALAWWEKRPKLLRTITAHELLSRIREDEAKAASEKEELQAAAGVPQPTA